MKLLLYLAHGRERNVIEVVEPGARCEDVGQVAEDEMVSDGELVR